MLMLSPTAWLSRVASTVPKLVAKHNEILVIPEMKIPAQKSAARPRPLALKWSMTKPLIIESKAMTLA